MKTFVYCDNILLNCFWNAMFQTKVVEKIKTHILYSIFFYENDAVREILWKKYGTARQATDYNVMQHGKGVMCMADN